jgi:hypothetical protein
MFTDMVVDINIHHGGIFHHTLFSYVGGDIKEVNRYDVDLLSMWEMKELVRELGYLNDIRCWYNVGSNHEQVISLNTDAEIVDFLNIVKMYKFEEVHLYVEHMVDHAIVVNEPLFFEACEAYVREGGDGVDKVHKAAREDGDGVSINEQFEILKQQIVKV